MKIVVLDHPRENPGEIDWSRLSSFGEVKRYARTDPDKIAETIGDAEIVFLNKSPLTKETLDKCPNIKFISVIATGYNTVDVAAAKQKNIPVANVPSYGTEAVGQQAIAHLLEITNHVAYNNAEVRKGRKSGEADWCFWDYPNVELAHKTMGIVGLGRIGQSVAKVALAFGMKVVAFDKIESQTMKDLGVSYVSLDELYAAADVISMHCPLFAENEKMINRESIAKMKDGVIFINASRGGLVDEDALAEALETGKIAWAGLDTLCPEPPDLNSRLMKAPNCFMTPHIGWAALECRQRLIRYSIDNLEAFLKGTPTNIVNP